MQPGGFMTQGMYLGKDVRSGNPYRLETEKLRTHGVVVGMTGSGKTGMALVILEELARAGVPVLAIDPKGDLGNLGLQFPELAPEQFAPWADGADATEVASRWKQGVERWGLDEPARREMADRLALSLYTPGSEAGISVNVLGALRRPDA